MKLEDLLRDGSNLADAVGATLDVEGPLTLENSLDLRGVDCRLRFIGAEASLRLVGTGPFRFQGLTFCHDEGLAPILVMASEARVHFSQCRFQGAHGGTEDALACAVRADGDSEWSFDECAFEDNDVHLMIGGDSRLELSGCSLKGSRADAVQAKERARIAVDECELLESGWNAMLLDGHSVADLRSSILSGSGCHGLLACDRTRLQSHDNHFTANRQHGICLQGEASCLSRRDHFADNELCGLDASDTTQLMLSESEAYGNGSHGLQLRGQSSGLFKSCRAGENQGSGLALFDGATISAQRLLAEENSLNGVQCGDDSRGMLNEATILGNLSSGLACFGQSRTTVEGCAFHGSLGYGVQLSERSHFRMSDCELGDNRKGGLLFANQAAGWVNGSTLADNGLHGVAVTDSATLALLDNVISNNQRDGVLLLGKGACQILRNQLLANGRHGLFAAGDARPLIDDNQTKDNGVQQILMETDAAKVVRMSAERAPSLEKPAGVTLTVEDGQSLHLPFLPKPIEESMLLALLKHGRLSEAALGKAAKSRRVGGAMENLIDRLNRAGMPVVRHDGEGPEGNVYALKIDTSRTRQTPGSRQTLAEDQGRQTSC